MNLHALRIFTKVASMKSVTKAAEAISISQPAVTIQIKNLEKEIGLKLMKTEGRGIKLTNEGEYLLGRAEQLFEMEKYIEKKLVHLRNGELAELKISSTNVPANFLLPTWLGRFKKEFPLINVNLFSGNSDSVIEQLLHYRADIAFVVKEEWIEPEVNKFHLLDIDYWFIVPHGHKYDGKEVLLKDLMAEPFIFREEGSSTRELLFSLCRVHRVPVPNIGLQFHGLNESLRSVMAGYGVMIAPSLGVEEYVKRKEVGRVKVKGVEISRPVFLCSRKSDASISNNVKKFTEFVKNIYLLEGSQF
ncbi:LysR family transcriptional regulator [Cytobacillus dafuensis]|uniref:LysR family transcriptional regulator n=1 Tax=Cytobacillus dafuensis TaxID=1742359 RepID=A0A5B8Z6Z2_CYTDA|nr:LysR family transcriptional regulator [Cytobacillus dafuensis]QED48875.1 LysR family transcriptional regulator [Cytobacillus dafuensis]